MCARCNPLGGLSSVLPAVFCGLAFLVAVRRLPFLHPTQVWTGSWAVATVLYALRLLPYIHLSWLTASLICGSIVAFAVGVPLGERIARIGGDGSATGPILSAPGAPGPSGSWAGERGAVELAALVALGLAALGLAAFLAHLIAKFGIAHVLLISPGVKVYLSSNEAPLSSTYVEFAVAAAALCALAAARAPGGRARGGWLVAAVGSAATVYFSTSRGFIAVALTAGLAAFALGMTDAYRRALVRLAVAMVIVTVLLFIGLGAVIGKTYGSSTLGDFDNFFSRHPALSSLALPYQDVTASIPALDRLVEHSPTWGVAHGCATAPIACGALRKLGVHTVRVPVAGTFTSAPVPWNAYTFLDRYLIDGGVAITLVLVAITGGVAGWLWALARARRTIGVLVYAITVPALVGAYRQNLIELVAIAAVIALALVLGARRVLRAPPVRRRMAALSAN